MRGEAAFKRADHSCTRGTTRALPLSAIRAADRIVRRTATGVAGSAAQRGGGAVVLGSRLAAIVN